jgi:murein L,D-transpeptidase YafK
LERFGGSTNYSSEEVSGLREEARRRIKSHLETNYLSPNSEQRLTLSNKIDNLVFIDTSGSRLIVFKNNGGETIKLMDAYISIGKNGSGKQFEGDKKTPIGVYALGNKIKQKLSDFYGDGAFPINYPNIYDKLQNKTGHGIWIHGTPKNTYSRAPQSSDGCVVLANDDLKRLEAILKSNKTKVIISEESYQSYLEKNLEDSHDNFIKALDEWKNSWESKFIANYLAFYDGDAKNNGRHYSDWTNDKFEIFRNTKNISVEIENISIIDYPDDKDTIRYVEFDQHYQSNLLINSSHKIQIWKKFNNDWKIINETSI